MYVDTEGPVIVSPHDFGFAFWDVGFERNLPELHPRLGWLVTAQLMDIDPAGAVSSEVANGQIRIGRINDAYQPSLNLQVPSRVGFYRYDIEITDAEGNLLGSYSEYLRVVAHSVKVRLGINGRRFRPGQTLATRPEELGTDWISFGEDFKVQRRSGGMWRSYPPMNPETWETWGGLAGAGAAGRCSYLHIPAGTPAGRYRIVKSVGVDIGRGPGLGLTLTAPFSIVTVSSS